VSANRDYSAWLAKTSPETAESRQETHDTVMRLREKQPGALPLFKPCAACGGLQAGPAHRKSLLLWTRRGERASANGGTDPVSGVTLDDAQRHLAAIPEIRTS